MFFTAFVLCSSRLLKLKTEDLNNIQKTSLQSYKTQIKILACPGLVNRVLNNPVQELCF